MEQKFYHSELNMVLVLLSQLVKNEVRLWYTTWISLLIDHLCIWKRIITPEDSEFFYELLRHNPQITVKEIQEKLQEHNGKVVSKEKWVNLVYLILPLKNVFILKIDAIPQIFF